MSAMATQLPQVVAAISEQAAALNDPVHIPTEIDTNMKVRARADLDTVGIGTGEMEGILLGKIGR